MNIKTYNRPGLKSRISPGLAVFVLANTADLLLNRLADKIDFEYFVSGDF